MTATTVHCPGCDRNTTRKRILPTNVGDRCKKCRDRMPGWAWKTRARRKRETA